MCPGEHIDYCGYAVHPMAIEQVCKSTVTEPGDFYYSLFYTYRTTIIILIIRSLRIALQMTNCKITYSIWGRGGGYVAKILLPKALTYTCIVQSTFLIYSATNYMFVIFNCMLQRKLITCIVQHSAWMTGLIDRRYW